MGLSNSTLFGATQTRSPPCNENVTISEKEAFPLAKSDDSEPPDEVNVIVTGYGIWDDDLDVPWPSPSFNSSWLITNALPRVIFRDDKPNIRIIIYPRPLRGQWTGLRKLIPDIWDGKKELFGLPIDPKKPGDDVFKVHAVLHTGCLDNRGEAFRLERNAFKKKYKLPDDDGKLPTHDDKTNGGEWKDYPYKLSTDIDIDKVLADVRESVKSKKVVISEDPNRWLCAWNYWVSLAELYKRNEMRRVIFMHTPIEGTSHDIEVGVKIATTVIKSMVADVEASAHV